jgi:DNA-damage-inducible protein J
MAANALVQTRIDGKVKAEAALVLAKFGLTVSDAVRMLLTTIVREKGLPLELKTPNEESRAAMREVDEFCRMRHAVRESKGLRT